MPSLLPLSMLRPANILSRPDYINHCILTTSAQAFDVPSGAGFVFFSGNADFACKYGSTGVTWPSTNVIDGSGNEINPTSRCVGSTQATTGLSLIAPAAGGVLTMAWFKPGG